VGAEGQVVPQQWLANTTAAEENLNDRRRLDLVVHGASAYDTALCCDAILVSLLQRNGEPQSGAAEEDKVVLQRARRRKKRVYSELLQREAARLVVLAFKVGER